MSLRTLMASGSLALLRRRCSTADPSRLLFAGPAHKSPRFASFSVSRRQRKRPHDVGHRLPLPSEAAAGVDDERASFLESCSISDFVRFRMVDDDDGRGGRTGELQTSVVSYRKRFPGSSRQPFLQVDLVSTTHIGDKEYFETLQKGLRTYDCVLYELLTSKESLENRNKLSKMKLKTSHSKGFNIQRQMARVLSLDYQWDCLDYQGSKWYHADLDDETFKALQIERGESFFKFARDMTDKAFIQPSSVPDNLDPWRSKLLWVSRVLPMPLLGLLIIGISKYPELEALCRLDIGAALKIYLARLLASESTQVTDVIDDSSVIVGERNKVAVEALRRAIDSGNKRIAVLYGYGHMPDLGRRLSKKFNMVPTQVNWVTAWSIRNRELESQSLPLLRTLAQVSGWPLNRYQTLELLIFFCVLAVDLWLWKLFFGTIAGLLGLPQR